MYLKTARIRHFKSLDDVTINFSPRITVIVGPNASGKSNIVDALRFVRDAAADGLEHAVSSRDGITRVRQHSRTKPFKLSISLDFQSATEENGTETEESDLNYSFTLVSKEGGNYYIENENGRIGRLPKDMMGLPLGSNSERIDSLEVLLNRDANGKFSVKPLQSIGQVSDDQLSLWSATGYLTSIDSNSIPAFLSGTRYHALYPNTLRELATPDKDSRLNESGKNYASVVKQLKRTKHGRESLERIYETLRQVVPSFSDVSVSTIGGYLAPKFRFAAEGGTVEYDPIQLSDGTLRVFGLLLALYQSPPPRLLLIEEPEQNIQPGVLAVLADAFREASERTQIIVTTHSPNFVDHFDPDEIRVTDLHQGLTRVANIKSSQKAAVMSRLLTLGEFMLSEGLEPEHLN